MGKLSKFVLYFFGFSFIFGGMISVFSIDEPLEDILKNDLLISDEMSIKLKNIFVEVGLDNYETIIHDELLDNAHGIGENGYRIKTNDVNNVILYLKEDINFIKIKYANEILFDGSKVTGKLLNMILTDDQKADLKIKTMEVVRQVLSFPETAKFPVIDGWKYGIIEGESVVQGYVESENAFKQTQKLEFQAKYKADALISLIVGDVEYIKK